MLSRHRRYLTTSSDQHIVISLHSAHVADRGKMGSRDQKASTEVMGTKRSGRAPGERAEATAPPPIAPDRPLSEIKAELFKALANPGRVRILEVLCEQDHTVTELVALVGLESSHVSQQLGILRRAAVVNARRNGSSMTYSIATPQVAELLAVAKRFLLDSLQRRHDVLAGTA
jgi:ArsR family transcriptional regulator